MPPVAIPLSDRVPERAAEPSQSRVGDGGDLERLLENMIGVLGVFGSKMNLLAKGQHKTMPEGTRWAPATASTWPRLVAVGPLQATFWLRTCFCLEIIPVNFQRIPRNFPEQLF